jgi:hypothetical protein
VRLYSKETAEGFKDETTPKVIGSKTLSFVLKCRSIMADVPNLKLIDDVPRAAEDSAVAVLQDFMALDGRGRIEQHGHLLLSFGVDVRLARFLVACHNHLCLKSGTQLAALLSQDAQDHLLPRRAQKTPLTAAMHDQSGDHMTMLAIFQAYDRAASKATFCIQHKFDVDKLKCISTACDDLQRRHISLGFVVDDLVEPGGITSAVLKSLSVAYSDQLGVQRSPGDLNQHLVQLGTGGSSAQTWACQTCTFVNALGDGDGAACEMCGEPPAPACIARISSDEPTEPQHDKILKVNDRSVLWHSPPCEEKLVLFSSVLSTDGSRPGESNASVASYITQEQVREASADWCNKVDFEGLLEQTERVTETLEVRSDECPRDQFVQCATQKNCSWLGKLREKYPSLHISVTVCCSFGNVLTI